MFTGFLAGFLKVAAIAVVTGGLAGGVIWAANAGGSDDNTAGTQAEASATVAVTPDVTAAPTATDQPLPTDPLATATPQPPAATATPPPPAPTGKFNPDPTCPPRMYDHVDIDRLRLQPSMADAVISEFNETTVQIVIEGIRFLVFGVGKVTAFGMPSNAPEALAETVAAAVQAVSSRC